MRVKLDDDLLLTAVDGSTVVLDAKNGIYLGTNDVGTRILELLRAHEDPERVIAALVDEYDVSEEKVRRDVQTVIDDLKSRRLLTVMDHGPANAPGERSILKSVLAKLGVIR
jgi:coenzyme PQQ synthesis protein D (PqqD)